MARAYDSDFAGWAEDTARAILEGRWSEIDCVALADEVDSLGKRDRREVRNRLEILFLQAYALARQRAASETSLPIDTFPVGMPFTELEIWGEAY